MLDFTQWDSWANSEREVLDPAHYEVFEFSRIGPDCCHGWKLGRAHNEECGCGWIQDCWTVDGAEVVMFRGTVANDRNFL